MKHREVKRVSGYSLARMGAAASAGVAIPLMFVAQVLGSTEWGFGGFLILLACAIVGGAVLGGICGFLVAAIYNVVSERVGGIKLTVAEN